VLLVGMAFKGWPATSDVRSSSSLVVADELRARGCELTANDAIVEPVELERIGLTPVSLEEGVRGADAVLILNNHPDNVPTGLLAALAGRDTLVFDGWGMLDRREVEDHAGVSYGTLGYLTPQRSAGLSGA
jgi:UDP-N-acetyl-D-mannosaminuronic acid dehydrogenase